MTAYIKKAWYYCRRNGLRRTFFAALERMSELNNDSYEWVPPSEEELERQRQRTFPSGGTTFSILAPAYETKPQFLRQMIASLMRQTYGKWELIIADASRTEQVADIVSEASSVLGAQLEKRIVYTRLRENAGISANTNEALKLASGDYIGLLDHDDVLTPNALYEMAVQIEAAAERGQTVAMLYSDEDKCNAKMTQFYEPHYKEEFNLDLILSNNYICHFLVMKAELMKRIQLQSAFDGAQDYKLVLDAVDTIMREAGAPGGAIVHIPKVLYHWRCHTDSTALNPQSKLYAYEAGKRAVDSFCQKQGWRGVTVEPLPHLGFYRLVYAGDAGKRNIFRARGDVGAVGGVILHRGRIAGGMYRQDGTTAYLGLYHRFSGYMHRAALAQEAEALDVRCVLVREELQPILQEIKCKYNISTKTMRRMPQELVREASLELADRIRRQGYRLVWDPAIRRRL